VTRGEVPLPRLRRAILGRAPLGDPFGQPAVEHSDIPVAEDAEHPPHARRAPQAKLVVDDDAVAVAKPELAHAGGEFLRAREHVREVALGVRNFVDVEEYGARDVTGLVVGAAALALRRPI